MKIFLLYFSLAVVLLNNSAYLCGAMMQQHKTNTSMKAIITNERGAYKHLNGQIASIRIDACGVLQFQNPESGFWTDTTFDKIKAI